MHPSEQFVLSCYDRDVAECVARDMGLKPGEWVYASTNPTQKHHRDRVLVGRSVQNKNQLVGEFSEAERFCLTSVYEMKTQGLKRGPVVDGFQTWEKA